MTISPPEREAKVKVTVDRDPVPTSFERWAKPGHFSRALSKGPKTTTWIWNLHANAHDFDSHTSDLEDISRKIFSAHFGHLAVVFVWLSGMYFHGAKFSNYSAWLADPLHVKPSARWSGRSSVRKFSTPMWGVDSRGFRLPLGFSNSGGRMGLPMSFNCTARRLGRW